MTTVDAGSPIDVRTVDADSHIIEGEHTWDFLEPSEQKFRPVIVEIPESADRRGMGTNGRERYYVNQGIGLPEVHWRLSEVAKDIPESVRDLTDVQARLAC